MLFQKHSYFPSFSEFFQSLYTEIFPEMYYMPISRWASILTRELMHGLSGHCRTVSAEVEFSHVGQYGGLPVSHTAEHAQQSLINR